MGSFTEIGNIAKLEEQGNDVVDTSVNFEHTVNTIYDLYDNLGSQWTGEKATVYKEKIEKMRDPLYTLIRAVNKQGTAVSDASKELQKFEQEV